MARASAAYNRFARYYDVIYRDIVNYAGDVDFLEAAFRRFSARPRTIVDLGCGTGNHALPLARRGYAVTGLDRSTEMLSFARRKAATAGMRVRFAKGDMKTFRFAQTFDVVICMFGAFGYLLTPTDVSRCLRRVRAHLAANGLFVFEFWQGSAAKPAPFQSWTHIASPGLEIIRLEESRFDPRTGRLPIEFRFFVIRRGRVVDRFDERHVVQTHSVPRVRALLRTSGFDLLGAFSGTTQRKDFTPPTKESFRVMAIARPRAQS